MGFLLGASPHAQRSVNKLLACLIHAFLSFLLHVSSYSALIPSLIVSFDVQKTDCIIPFCERYYVGLWIEVIMENGGFIDV